MPNLLAIAPYPVRSADTRYRIAEFIPALEAAGWHVILKPFMSERLFNIYNQPGKAVEKIWLTLGCMNNRLKDLRIAEKVDVVFLHKEAFPFGPPWIERTLRKRVKTIIYDMDDAFWTHPPQFKQIGKALRDPKRIQKILGMSDVVLAGNDFLAEFARQFNPNVIVFPTVLDTDRYTLRKENDDGIITIGWVGRWSSDSYLNQLMPVFKNLSERYKNLEYKFIGATKNKFPGGLPVKVEPWRLESEIEDIASFDIGIMPLLNDDYSRGKCGFKLLQYMALGIPAVASPVGVNNKIVQHGVNGYLAWNQQEWEEHLSMLIEDKNRRRVIGIKGRRTVEEHYSLQDAAPKLLTILNSSLEEKS